MSATRYTQLLQEFSLLLGADFPEVDASSGLEFEHDDLLVKIYAYPDCTKVAVDVEIFKLEPSAEPEVNEQRLRLLHQLNSLTRFTDGALATVNLDNVLLLGCALDLETLTAEELVTVFNNMIESGLDLRAMWSEMWNLIEQVQNEIASLQNHSNEGITPMYA
jgi:hypothetical protein